MSGAEWLFSGKANKDLRHLFYTFERLSYKLFKTGIINDFEDFTNELFKELDLFFDHPHPEILLEKDDSKLPPNCRTGVIIICEDMESIRNLKGDIKTNKTSVENDINKIKDFIGYHKFREGLIEFCRSSDSIITKLDQNKNIIEDAKEKLIQDICRCNDKMRNSGIISKGQLVFPIYDEKYNIGSIFHMTCVAAKSGICSSFCNPDELLFSIGLGFQSDLEQKIVSDKLKQEFVNKDIILSKNAIVLIEKIDVWQIKDGQRVYIIKKEGDILNIYPDECFISKIISSCKDEENSQKGNRNFFNHFMEMILEINVKAIHFLPGQQLDSKLKNGKYSAFSTTINLLFNRLIEMSKFMLGQSIEPLQVFLLEGKFLNKFFRYYDELPIFESMFKDIREIEGKKNAADFARFVNQHYKVLFDEFKSQEAKKFYAMKDEEYNSLTAEDKETFDEIFMALVESCDRIMTKGIPVFETLQCLQLKMGIVKRVFDLGLPQIRRIWTRDKDILSSKIQSQYDGNTYPLLSFECFRFRFWQKMNKRDIIQIPIVLNKKVIGSLAVLLELKEAVSENRRILYSLVTLVEEFAPAILDALYVDFVSDMQKIFNMSANIHIDKLLKLISYNSILYEAFPTVLFKKDNEFINISDDDIKYFLKNDEIREVLLKSKLFFKPDEDKYIKNGIEIYKDSVNLAQSDVGRSLDIMNSKVTYRIIFVDKIIDSKTIADSEFKNVRSTNVVWKNFEDLVMGSVERGIDNILLQKNIIEQREQVARDKATSEVSMFYLHAAKNYIDDVRGANERREMDTTDWMLRFLKGSTAFGYIGSAGLAPTYFELGDAKTEYRDEGLLRSPSNCLAFTLRIAFELALSEYERKNQGRRVFRLENLDIQNDSDKENILQRLCYEFKKKGLQISHELFKYNNKWLIVDKDKKQMYSIIKNRDRLEIYEENQNPFMIYLTDNDRKYVIFHNFDIFRNLSIRSVLGNLENLKFLNGKHDDEETLLFCINPYWYEVRKPIDRELSDWFKNNSLSNKTESLDFNLQLDSVIGAFAEVYTNFFRHAYPKELQVELIDNGGLMQISFTNPKGPRSSGTSKGLVALAAYFKNFVNERNGIEVRENDKTFSITCNMDLKYIIDKFQRGESNV